MREFVASEHPVWYPYAQQAHLEPYPEVVFAQGSKIHLSNGAVLIDAISSWWSVIHGYNHPYINQKVQEQLQRFSHVMLGGLTHAPVQNLAQKLIEKLPESLNHVFFSDSGSVGVEVALKMALQFYHNQNNSNKNRFLALRGGYHGDTFGALGVGDPEDAMHAAFPELFGQNFWISPPRASSDEIEIQQKINEFEHFLAQHHSHIAAFICEPLVQCYGGFNTYSPIYLQQICNLCKEYNVLIIFDEVATGFGRTGAFTAAQKAQVEPDIMILGKGLTAGYAGMSATVASSSVFLGFWGKEHSLAFMHGPTFMGNALTCAAALAGLELFDLHHTLDQVAQIEAIFKEEMLHFSHPLIQEIRICGAILAIEVKDASSYLGLALFAQKQGVWCRPFGKYIYSMPAYILSETELRLICQVFKSWFNLKAEGFDITPPHNAPN